MKLNIDWTKVDSRYKYVAMDADGDVFLYEELPSLLHLVWDSCGNYESFKGGVGWKETLTERPTEEIKMKVYLPHQQRVIAERDELRKKLDALVHFVSFNPAVFNLLSKSEQNLLRKQSIVMCQYLEILDERIVAFTEQP